MTVAAVNTAAAITATEGLAAIKKKRLESLSGKGDHPDSTPVESPLSLCGFMLLWRDEWTFYSIVPSTSRHLWLWIMAL